MGVGRKKDGERLVGEYDDEGGEGGEDGEDG